MTNRRMMSGRVLTTGLAMVCALALAPRAQAEDYVGWVSALDGTGEVLRPGGEWTALAPADGLSQGDQVRTLAASRMKILLRDDSVLTLGESSQLRLDEQVSGKAPQSTFWLLFGTIRAIATERYGAAGAHFEVKTPTAIAGVRGTEFVAQHDKKDDETLVVGIVDTTVVRAAIDAAGKRAVRLGPGEATRVRRGSYPTPAVTMPSGQVRGLINATATKSAGVAGKQGKATTEGEPRLPPGRAEGAGSPAERVVDTPFGTKKKGRPAPPPPPPPGN